MLSPGATFGGYQVESVVGLGGIGVLYRARQLRLDRPVALKLVDASVARDPVIRSASWSRHSRMRSRARSMIDLWVRTPGIASP